MGTRKFVDANRLLWLDLHSNAFKMINKKI